MGLETELELRKGHREGLKPQTFTVPHKVNRLSLKEDFREINFANTELKRGSIYQSSGEVNKTKRRGSTEGRRKIEVPRSSYGASSFRVIDTLCSSDEEIQQERSSVMSQNSNFSPASVSRPYIEPSSSDDFFEICLDSCSPENFGVDPIGDELQIHSSIRASSKTRFSPIRKMFDPFMKSKPTRSPLRNKTLCKSLLDDFSKVNNTLVDDSPVHLHGHLKIENKDGKPHFEFSLKCPEDVLVAKAWKTDKASNWVYTFHSIDGRKRSNESSCSMLGQMQVSCSSCQELRDERVLHNSMMMEFVLYDLARARKNDSSLSKGSDKPNLAKVNPQPKQVLGNRELDSSYPYPWAQSDLNPNLEIAATVIEIPIGKRESSKLSEINPKGRVMDSSSSVKVVIPSGHHGLPSDESQCPSSLLDRWRNGGGCDCSGWDMACPLIVFANPNLGYSEDLELFVQGSKENVPALTLTFIEEGEYKVDFHAQFSTLQAFSICVAILHSTEASTAAGQERILQLPQCSSLKMLMEEEVKFYIESVMEEEKRKVTKAPFKLNPPFSPIARV